MDATLQSILSFVRNCPTLLLDVPDALTRSSLLLESLLAVVSNDGRLANPTQQNAVSRLDIIKSSLMDAFSWLPPGSYPMVADQLFEWASDHIKIGSDSDISSSLLSSLLDSEDAVLDVCSYTTAKHSFEVGEDSMMLDSLSLKSAIIIDHAEREALLHSRPSSSTYSTLTGAYSDGISSSSTFGDTSQHGHKKVHPPTPMHAAGNWKPPPTPFGASSIRLMDACIHMFSTLFGLQDSRAQVKAINMLMSLLPSTFFQSKSFNPTASLSSTFTSETEKEAKLKYNNRLTVNIVTSLLCCLQALPVHEGNLASDMGWVSKAMELLLLLLPSPLTYVRRGAAESIGLLCTRVKGSLINDTVAQLQNVLEGLYPNGKKRSDFNAVQYSKCGAVLALACIGRGGAVKSRELCMMCLNMATDDSGSELLKTWSLYSVGVLLDHVDLGVDSSAIRKHLHLMSDVVDMLLSRFLSDWTESRGNGLSTIIRLQNIMLPIFFELDPSHPAVSTLCSIVDVLKGYGHATVLHECLKFIELIAVFDATRINTTESLEFLISIIDSVGSAAIIGSHDADCFGSGNVLKTTVSCIRGFAMMMRAGNELFDLKLHAHLLNLLDSVVAKQNCAHGDFYRGAAVSRGVEAIKKETSDLVVKEIEGSLEVLLEVDGRYNHLLLFSKGVLRGEMAKGAFEANAARDEEEEEEENTGEAAGVQEKEAEVVQWNRELVVKFARHSALVESGLVTALRPCRWQVKRLATKISISCLAAISETVVYHFDIASARTKVQEGCRAYNEELAKVALANKGKKKKEIENKTSYVSIAGAF